MTKKIKNRHKQQQQKAQKAKKRREKIKRQAAILSQPREKVMLDVEHTVDYALGLVESDVQQAEQVLAGIKGKYKNHPYVIYGRGMIGALKEDYEQAIPLLGMAAGMMPDFPEVHYNLGLAFQKTLQIPEMIMVYQRVIEIGEPGSVPVNHAQNVLTKLERSIYENSGISLEEYFNAYRYFQQGFAFMESQEWDKAIDNFSQAAEIDANTAPTYGNLGICYAHLGKKQKSLEAFAKALELDPEYEPALLNRELVKQLKEGECMEAQAKVVEYYKDYPLKNKSFIQEYIKSRENGGR